MILLEASDSETLSERARPNEATLFNHDYAYAFIALSGRVRRSYICATDGPNSQSGAVENGGRAKRTAGAMPCPAETATDLAQVHMGEDWTAPPHARSVQAHMCTCHGSRWHRRVGAAAAQHATMEHATGGMRR